jgi:two-component system cell cycle response regulator DivK
MASEARCSVLIVDDYQDSCEMYAAYLTFAGFQALKAGDGFEALRLAVDARPDVILMDLNLPGIDGFEVTRRLKADPRTSHIPVMALTAHASLAQADTLRHRGFVELVLKPCPPDMLALKIGRLAAIARGVPGPSGTSIETQDSDA